MNEMIMTKIKRREDKLSQNEKLEDFLKFLESLQNDDLKQESVIAAAKVYTQYLPVIGAMTSQKASGRSPDRLGSRDELSYIVEPLWLMQCILEVLQQEESKTGSEQSKSLDELSGVELTHSFKNLIESVADQSMCPAMTDEGVSKALKGFYTVEARYGYRYLGQRLREFLKGLSSTNEDDIKGLIDGAIEVVKAKIVLQKRIESNKENLKTVPGKRKAVATIDARLGHVDPNSKSSNRLQKQHDKLGIGLFELPDDSGRSPEGGKKIKGANNPNAKPLFGDGYSSDGSKTPSPGFG